MKKKPSSSLQRRQNKNPLSVLTEARWNVFDDFSAFRTYFNLLMMAVGVLSLQLVFIGEYSRAGAFSLCSAASLAPLGAWCYGKARGLPIFPVYALTYFATFAIQIYLQDELRDARNFFPPDPSNHWWAAWAVALALIPGMMVWLNMNKKGQQPPEQCHVINRSFANYLMLFMFIASSLLIAALATEKFSFLGRIGSILNAAARTGSVVSLFILSFQFGMGRLSGRVAVLVGIFLSLNIIASMASLFLGGAISVMAVAVAGYSLGKRRIPWLLAVVLFPLLSVLHAGKGDMRVKYWGEARAVKTVGFLEYPAFFMEWFEMGYEDLTRKKPSGVAISETEENLLERSSLIEIFLTAHKLAPETVPYLHGETYQSIPLLLIPRFLYPDKPVAHEGQRLLNVHYRVQSTEAVVQTYIAWGLMNEAFANFGYWGLPVFGIIIGLFFGGIARFCSSVPLLSFRGLLGALTIGFSIQAEMAAGVWVTSFSQSIILLVLLRWVVMKPELNPMYADTPASSNSSNKSRSRYSVRKFSP
ncbi:MAG: hypothetical protein AAF649_01225 [Verrucomicrobiota bacterium]